MIGSVGDAFLDVSARLDGPLKAKTDTPASIQARQGGSAANVAVEAAKLCGSSKFIGIIGADFLGDQIFTELSRQGVEVCCPRTGRTGCLVALLNEEGEASMLTDRKDAAQLSNWSPQWLEGIKALHVTSYALFAEPMASVSCELMAAAAQRSILVSVDVSSVGGVEELGVAKYVAMLKELPLDILLLSAAEAELLAAHVELSALADVVVIKQGAGPTLLLGDIGSDQSSGKTANPKQFPPPQLAEVIDTVGAGDALAAGLLVARAVEGKSWDEAVLAGQKTAADLLRRRTQSRAVDV